MARRLAADVLGAPAAGRRRAARAARLAKADLATDMVREFTELQGVMGGVYAREAGEPEAVWKAIYHHYLPIGVESSAAPTAECAWRGAAMTWACAVAGRQARHARRDCSWPASGRPDRAIRLGLRRQAHGVLRILLDLGALAG